MVVLKIENDSLQHRHLLNEIDVSHEHNFQEKQKKINAEKTAFLKVALDYSSRLWPRISFLATSNHVASAPLVSPLVQRPNHHNPAAFPVAPQFFAESYDRIATAQSEMKYFAPGWKMKEWIATGALRPNAVSSASQRSILVTKETMRRQRE